MFNEAIQFSLGTSNSALKSGLAEAKAQVSNFKGQVTGMVTGLFAGIGVQQLISDFARVQDLADGLGTTAEAIQRVRGAAELSGTGVEAIAKALAKLRSDGGDALEKLGIDANDFAHAGMDEQVLMISKALDGIADPQQRINTALEIFGVKGKEILPMISQGYAALKDSMDSTAVASNETVANIARMDDQIADVTNTLKVWAADGIGAVVDAINAMSAAAGLAFAYISNLPKGFAAAEQAAEDYRDAYHQLEFEKQVEAEQKAAGQKSNADWTPAAEKGAGGKESKSLAERTSDLEAAAAQKQLAIWEQLAAVGLKRVDLERELEAASDPEKKKAIEEQLLANTKERLSLEDQNRKEGERWEKESADEQSRNLAKWEADQAKAKKESARIEKEQIMAAFKERQNDIGFASGINPNAGTGQRLSGVNYDVINAEAEKGIRLQEEMRNYLKSIDEKSWSVEVPEAE